MIRFMLVLVLAGCPAHTVLRDAATFQIETMAALARQEEAAGALRVAAVAALEQGDRASCVLYAEPALLIEAAAQAQAYRALWLAGLPYPTEDGSMPPEGTAQPDPGPSTKAPAASTICGQE